MDPFSIEWAPQEQREAEQHEQWAAQFNRSLDQQLVEHGFLAATPASLGQAAPTTPPATRVEISARTPEKGASTLTTSEMTQ